MLKRFLSLCIRFSAVFIVELFYKDVWELRRKNTKYYLNYTMAI